jgi:peptidoglycan-associated lipoprotein
MSRHLQLVGIALAVIFFLIVLYMMHQRDNYYEQFSLIQRGVAQSSRGMTDAGNANSGSSTGQVVTERREDDHATEKEARSFTVIYFEYDRYFLTEQSKAVLNTHARWLNSHLHYFVSIVGHCDDRGSFEYNLALGKKRAEAVKTYLVGRGVDTKRMIVISYGEHKPAASGQDEKARKLNRRVEFVVLPELTLQLRDSHAYHRVCDACEPNFIA